MPLLAVTKSLSIRAATSNLIVLTTIKEDVPSRSEGLRLLLQDTIQAESIGNEGYKVCFGGDYHHQPNQWKEVPGET